jgi:hypothetical protein
MILMDTDSLTLHQVGSHSRQLRRSPFEHRRIAEELNKDRHFRAQDA